MPLVSTHHQTPRVAPEIDEQVGVTHGGQVVGDRLPEPRHQVLMRHGDDGDGQTSHGCDLRRVDATGVDHHLGSDRAVARLHSGHPASIDADARDSDSLVKGCAAAASPFGESERQTARVQVSVGRKKGCAQDAVCGHQRKPSTGFGPIHDLQRKPKALSPTCLPVELLHSRRRRSQPQAAHLAPPRVYPGLILEPPVEVDAQHHHSRQGLGRAQLPHQAGGVEGRSTRELGSLDQDGLPPPALGEVIGDAGAAHAAADDDGARA